ncbi:MAG: ATPase domain-containing protein [Nanoarchaeota archaeon]
MDKKDKKRVTVIDLLKAYPDGLSIQDLVDKAQLARHTVLARLHRLEGEGKIRMRQVNMAKLYYWIDEKGQGEAEQSETHKMLQIASLQEDHFKKKVVEKIPKGETKKEKSLFDAKLIKEQIQQELKSGNLKQPEIELQKQRLPISHVLSKAKEKKSEKSHDFLKINIPGFDDLLEHGIPRGNSILIAGGAGSGKTIFCLQALYNRALEGEKCLYMSFEESEEHLIEHMENFGWNPRALIKKGNLLIKRFNPFDITRSVDALLMKAKGELLIDIEPIVFPDGFHPDILALDSLTAVASAFLGREDSYRIYIEQLFRFFEQIKATSFLITETELVPKIFSTSGVEEFLADGVIVLYAIKRGNVRENAVEVLKMRGEHHQKKIVALQINENGIVVYPEQEVFGGLEGS